MWNRLNFRNKLLFTLIPITTLAMVALGIIAYCCASKVVMDDEIVSMTQIVEKTTTELDMWVSDRERDVVLFATNSVFKDACKGNNLKEAQELLETYHKNSPVSESIFLADAKGKLFLDSIGGKCVGVELSRLEGCKILYEKAIEKKVWISDAMQSPITGRPGIVVTAPIMDGDSVIGIVGTPIDLTYFTDAFVSKFKILDTGYIYMMDSTGMALAHPRKENILKVNFAKDYDWGKKIVSMKNGSIEYNFDGVAKVVSFGTSSKKGWIAAATAPKAELLSSLTNIQSYAWISVLTAIALVSLVVWLLAGSLFRVIKRVSLNLGEAGDQIALASGQVSSASQSLAEGASEQAAGIEETSSSIEEMSSMTKQNADNAHQANALMVEGGMIITEADQSMQELIQSMGELSTASDQTAKIVKTIDEIAFQTNLLALNAAVEAARAGEAGAGFAVVADEVRNLAMRAAEAAKNTASLIEVTVKKIKQGSEIAGKTKEAFGRVSVSARKVGELVGEIAAASQEQRQGIEQINKAVAEMETVVQGNAGSAEETASASEEMNAQAVQMKEFVRALVAVVEGGGMNGGASLAIPDKRRHTATGSPRGALVCVEKPGSYRSDFGWNHSN
ncbi:MAG: methyl-accepting chemotaxis protein [Syntrophobacteraceae bacterium]